MLKGSEIMDGGLNIVAGIKGNITVPSCPERRASREGRSARERAGKGSLSRRKSHIP